MLRTDAIRLYVRKMHRQTSVAVLLFCLAWGVWSPAKASDDIRALIEQQFIRYDPNYVENRARLGNRLEALSSRLAELEAEGHELHCSKQIFLEAKWLHRYTAYWDKLTEKLDRLELSLEDRDQAFAKKQLPTTGHWGVCYEAHFMRIAATVDALSDLLSRGERPRYRLRADGPLNTGKKLLLRLADLLLSDIANTGVNHRGELNSLLTSISRGLFKHWMREGLNDYIDLPSGSSLENLAGALRFYLSGAQDAETGYWGAWYVIEGKFYKTADLSMTYHIVSYTKGKGIERWPEIIDTTFAIEAEPYPYGWRHNGRYNNHNNYDVAKIYRYAWPHMTDAQRAQAAAQLSAMVEWSLSNTLKPDGTFVHDPTFSDSLADEFYFGVSFFDVVGLWNPEKRFWPTTAPYQDARALCCRIHRRLEELGLSGWAADGAREKLERNCSAC